LTWKTPPATWRSGSTGRAGKKRFYAAAIEEIYAVSKGVPRKINNLCDLALLIGYSKNQEMVDVDVVETIIRDGALL